VSSLFGQESSSAYQLILGDCLEAMWQIPDGSVDMILCDLPYGTTRCAWDAVIPFEPLWEQYRRVIKPNGAIVLTAAQPFTTALIASNLDWFKYCWVWDKVGSVGFLNAKLRPLVRHEDIVVFYQQQPTYNPQMRTGVRRMKGGRKDKEDQVYGNCAWEAVESDQYYPTSILEVSNASKTDRVHPTQKPVALFEYLIRTYTNPGDLVLDNTMGSGTTVVAALNTGRRAIGIEMDPAYFEVAKKRVEAIQMPLLAA
jgi:site-specific DNA-methyltransferase (adenine-specific)